MILPFQTMRGAGDRFAKNMITDARARKTPISAETGEDAKRRQGHVVSFIRSSTPPPQLNELNALNELNESRPEKHPEFQPCMKPTPPTQRTLTRNELIFNDLSFVCETLSAYAFLGNEPTPRETSWWHQP